MAAQEVLREVHLKVDTRFALVKVLGEAGQEARDKNMPRNLHNAAELFLRCGMVDQAELQKTTSDMLDIADEPDGSSHSMGRAAVCWECGCGLPREAGGGAGVRRVRRRQPELAPRREKAAGRALDRRRR
ncbi:potassium:proton antiporter [Aureococcus anophagefferens]|nr:potassium:proton antiporter [Aureococcus anophagefferens]